MTTRYVLDAGGQPRRCDDLLEWGAWYASADRTVVRDALETPAGPVEVSTIFFGFSLPSGRCETPLLFETLIIGGPLDDWREQYATREEAVRGHYRALALARGDSSPEGLKE